MLRKRSPTLASNSVSYLRSAVSQVDKVAARRICLAMETQTS
jgi:hypothetical protein